MTDEVHDIRAQSRDAAIDTAPGLPVCDGCKEALDLIEPGPAGQHGMDIERLAASAFSSLRSSSLRI